MSKLLAGLGMLGAALAGSRKGVARESGRRAFYKFVDNHELMKVYERLMKEDEQSAKLLLDVVQELQDRLDIDTGANEALSRVVGVARNGKHWDIGLLRNNIFKAANSLEMELPSHMF